MLANKSVYALLMLLLVLNAYALSVEARHASIRAASAPVDDDDNDYAYDDDDYEGDDGGDDDDDGDYGNMPMPLYPPPGSQVPPGANGDYVQDYGDYASGEADDRAGIGIGGGGGGIGGSDDDCEEDNSTSNNTTTKRPTTFGPLCVAFRTLRNIVPMQRLVRITAQHYRHDRRFRRAMAFVQSVRFLRAAQRVENTAAYRRMLRRFAIAGVDARELHIAGLLECVLLPVLRVVQQQQQQQPQTASSQVVAPKARSAATLAALYGGDEGVARSLGSYTHDIWRAIPRSKFRNAIGVQLSTSPDFAKFYHVMRTVNFRRDVLHGLSTKSLRDATRTLRENFINLRQLLRFVFRVMSLGPQNPIALLPHAKRHKA